MAQPNVALTVQFVLSTPRISSRAKRTARAKRVTLEQHALSELSLSEAGRAKRAYEGPSPLQQL